MLFLLVSFALALVFALSLTARAGLPDRRSNWVAVPLLVYANLILTALLAGLTFQFDSPLFWLATQMALAGGAYAYAGRPSFRFTLPRLTRAMVVASLRRHPVLWVLGVFLVGLYALAAVITVIMPPNEFDTLSYRLVRVIYWLQHGHIYPWDTHDYRQITYPPNTELLWGWTILGLGTDRLVGMVGWTVTPVVAGLVYAMGRLLAFTRSQSLFAALLWLTLPLTVLQSVSTQNDALLAFFAVGSIYFLYLGLKSGHRGALLLSGVGFGLALGTKTTVLFFLPGYALLALLLWLRRPREQFRAFLTWGVACIVGFAVFGSFIYVTNFVGLGSPIGAPSFIERASAADQSRLDLLRLNAPRYVAQMVDFTGLPPEQTHQWTQQRRIMLIRYEHHLPFVSENFRNWIYYTPPPHETLAWFGPLGFLVFVPGLAVGAWWAYRRRDLYLLGLVIIPPVFVLMHSIGLYWSPFRGRYHIPPVALAAPLMAWVVLVWRPVRWAVVALAIVVAVGTLNWNALRPLSGEQTIWNMSAMDRLTLSRDEPVTFIQQIEDEVPKDAVVGVALVTLPNAYNLEYLFFGREFSRTLVPLRITDPDRLPADSLTALVERGITYTLVTPPGESAPTPDYLIVHEDILAQLDDHSGFTTLASEHGLHLMRRTS